MPGIATGTKQCTFETPPYEARRSQAECQDQMSGSSFCQFVGSRAGLHAKHYLTPVFTTEYPILVQFTAAIILKAMMNRGLRLFTRQWLLLWFSMWLSKRRVHSIPLFRPAFSNDSLTVLFRWGCKLQFRILFLKNKCKIECVRNWGRWKPFKCQRERGESEQKKRRKRAHSHPP
jgi:hypothetical protein